MRFPGDASGKEPACQWGRHKRHWFNPWMGKIPWRRTWQPSPVFLPRESHGQRSLLGYSPECHKESDTTAATYHTHTLKVKTRMVVWVQNESKCVGCLHSWFQGWPGAQPTAARSSAHCCFPESSRVVQSFWKICHMLLGSKNIKFKNSKYGFYWMCIAFLPLESQKTEINTRSWWQFVAIKRNRLLIHLVA